MKRWEFSWEIEPEPGAPEPGASWTWRLVPEAGSRAEWTFRWIPPGTFRMGARGYESREEPVHSVTVQGFWMGQTPVTQSQYLAATGENPSHFSDVPDAPRRPVECISWFMAKEVCGRLDDALPDRLRSLWSVRMPTEPEWEYACRAGTETEFHSGDGEEALARAGWYVTNSGRHTHAVGRKSPNPWNLEDMHGNVWEWCADIWKRESYALRPPDYCAGGPPEDHPDAERVMRGGSYWLPPIHMRSAYRAGRPPTENGSEDDGFRICLGTRNNRPGEHPCRT